MELSFIIIDDAELDHFIAKKLIEHIDNAFPVKCFLDATEALEYIATSKSSTVPSITVVILDIYMPLMNGFEFIEAFEKLEPQIQDNYYLIALTSTREPYDINRVGSYQSVRGMINKPITHNDLSVLITKVSAEYGIPLM